MHSLKKLPAIIFSASLLVSLVANAEGVFLNKKRNMHELSSAEIKQLKVEFVQKFGKKNSVVVRSNNPWKAKKQRGQQIQRTVSWGECRDFVLEKRNHCYQEGRGAYQCERLYEARSIKCDNDY